METENEKLVKLVTHDGSFHADDIFACAVFSILLEQKGIKFELLRTRDPEIIKSGDYVFDVGGVYDEANNRFDHHQTGGAGRRANQIEYASIGLVWKKFGVEICENQKVADLVDKKLIAPIDAGDNGMSLVESTHDVAPYFLQNFFNAMRPTWKETDLSDMEMFLKCVEIAKVILSREIINAEDTVLAEESVDALYQSTEDKKIIVSEVNYPLEFLLQKYPEPIFTVGLRKESNTWGARAIRQDLKTFKNRKDFPSAWAGLMNEELQKVSGVPDAIFCHRSLFLAVAKSKEGAIKLAQIALES